jgi:peptidoglycan/LPS O-acetylase OafA/YrhL
VAVLLVLADHFRTHFSGGYVGVDVFFVISGYLIGAAILKEMADGTFSIVNFYERRIRRIFPALIVMLLGASALAYRYLFPTELAGFARSLLAAMFSVSNFWFWKQAGYFSTQSAFKPLLHTWSLAVEEQFYVVFPILLMLIRRLAPKRLKAVLFAVAALTFALAIFYVRRDATAAFFFSPLRAWELLLGTIVSQRFLPAIRSAAARNVATMAGILMILVPSLMYTADTPFPGLAALPPCLGAALIIAGGEMGSSLVGRVLSFRPVVGVGLISYSLYLWHWPVLVFQNIGGLVAPLPQQDRRLKLAMFAISLALGYLSWRFVETPFRKGPLRPGRRALFAINGAGVALITAIGVGILLSRGLPSRFPPEAIAAAKYLDYSRRGPFREGVCFLGSDDRFSDFQPSACLAEDPAKKNVLLLGDSQAAQLWYGLKTVFPDVQFLQATAFACPLYAIEPKTVLPACAALADYVHRDFLSGHHVDAVVFGGRWIDQDVPAIARELAWMQQRGIKVYLVGPMTEYDEPFPRLLATSLRDGRPELMASHLTDAPRTLDGKLAALARDSWHVPYLSYFENLCTPQCPGYGPAGVPLLFDEHHLTADGSTLFARTLRDRGQLAVAEGKP